MGNMNRIIQHVGGGLVIEDVLPDDNMIKKHIAIVIVSEELAEGFRSNLPGNTRIISEGYHQEFSKNMVYFKIESNALPETEAGMRYPVVKGVFKRLDNGTIVFIEWQVVDVNNVIVAGMKTP